ncbi:hypothetical protein BpHYR1_028802 [Brachionus plicatilis]|uniref:Uncharacterized protein n=1 Tax=Brachionus plicatilis TaxID=10195 RepID=A0A3M7P8V9_BRAPC|nr:hypothetical protein BpHYR1_028802 [Brachionus plicatilis]
MTPSTIRIGSLHSISLTLLPNKTYLVKRKSVKSRADIVQIESVTDATMHNKVSVVARLALQRCCQR